MDDVSKCLDQSIESLDHECLNVFFTYIYTCTNIAVKKTQDPLFVLCKIMLPGKGGWEGVYFLCKE